MRTGIELKAAFYNLWNETVNILPTILIGLLILVGGWIIAKVVSKLILKLLNRTKNSKLSKQLALDSVSEKYGIEVELPVIISKMVYWIVFLFFIVAASETFGFSNVSTEISVFIHFIPKLLSAVLIFIIGYSITRFVRDAVKGMSKTMELPIGRILADILFYFLLMIVALTAIAQIGIDINIISTHMYIIIGAISLTVCIALGWGSREIVSDILKNHYNRGVINVGDTLIYNNNEGLIEKVTRTSIVYKVKDTSHVIPAKELYASTYSIKTNA